MQGDFTLCVFCTRFNHDEQGIPFCEAFPDGIPNEILHEGYDHRQPFEGDGGILFESDGRKDNAFFDRVLVPAEVEEEAQRRRSGFSVVD